ncbi:MAG: YncE family protein [Acidimicrobiales bacterium]
MRNSGGDRLRRRASGPLLIGVAALALSACGGGGKPASTVPSSTLPPLPPSVVAYVAMAGSGANLGYGHDLQSVTVSGSAGGPVVGKKIAVGTYPDAVAVNPAGTMAYVANYSSGSVTPVNLATDTPGTPIDAGVGPAGIAITPDGKTAYVTDDGSASVLGDTVTPIDLATGKPGTPITVGSGPQGIVITPDGSTAYVADAGAIVTGQSGGVGNTVTPIDLSTNTAGRPITVGNGPTGMAITTDGTVVFVTNLDSGSVTPIATANNSAGAPIAVPGGPVAVTIGGGDAWVVDTPSNTSAGNNVVPISISSDTAGAPIAVPKGPQDIAITPDGKTAWVTCLNADALVPIAIATKTVGASITLEGGPFALAIADQVLGGGRGATTTTTTAAATTSATVKHKKKKKS